MKRRCDFYSDTDPAALEVFLDLQRRMPPEKKLAMVFSSIRLLSGLGEAAIRRDYPTASDREIFLRQAARRLDRETMIRVYDWDPDAHG
jgi:hypothetical protein